MMVSGTYENNEHIYIDKAHNILQTMIEAPEVFENVEMDKLVDLYIKRTTLRYDSNKTPRELYMGEYYSLVEALEEHLNDEQLLFLKLKGVM